MSCKNDSCDKCPLAARAGVPLDRVKFAGVELYQVDKQIADIENTIQQHPDGIISIPVDFTATAPTYKKVSQAGIKLVFMDSIPTGLEHPKEYASMISADSQGNGQIAAQILASCVDKGGTIGLVNFGVDYFSTNERAKGVREWMQKSRPDIKMKQVDNVRRQMI